MAVNPGWMEYFHIRPFVGPSHIATSRSNRQGRCRSEKHPAVSNMLAARQYWQADLSASMVPWVSSSHEHHQMQSICASAQSVYRQSCDEQDPGRAGKHVARDRHHRHSHIHIFRSSLRRSLARRICATSMRFIEVSLCYGRGLQAWVYRLYLDGSEGSCGFASSVSVPLGKPSMILHTPSWAFQRRQSGGVCRGSKIRQTSDGIFAFRTLMGTLRRTTIRVSCTDLPGASARPELRHSRPAG